MLLLNHVQTSNEYDSETGADYEHRRTPERYMLAALLERAINDLDLDKDRNTQGEAIAWFKNRRGHKPEFTFAQVKKELTLSVSRLKFIKIRVEEAIHARNNNIVRFHGRPTRAENNSRAATNRHGFFTRVQKV